jgi:hypothetical protein
MDNKQLFIDGYLTRISEQFNVEKNIAFEIFSIAAITERPFQEVYDESKLDKSWMEKPISRVKMVGSMGLYL